MAGWTGGGTVRPMLMWLLASSLALSAAGCIESQRAQAPPQDTAAPDDGATDTVTQDTVVGPDDTLVQDTVRPGDAGDDVKDVREPECTGNGDCVGVDVGPCEVAQCEDRRCVIVAGREGLPCDDGDACTRDTACDGGFCKRGTPVACAAPDETCREATCDPSSGCMTVKAAEGAACDNGAGPEVGVCTDQGWAESDACSANGECLDRYRPSSSGSASAAGSWYFVASTAGTAATMETARGWMELGAGGGVTLAGVTTSVDPAGNPSVTSPWSDATAGTPVGGFGCGDATGRVALVLADGQPFRGQHTPNARALAALEPEARRLLVAVRPTGQVAQVHGNYRFVSSSQDDDGPPRTWFGELEFEEGCVTAVGGAFLTGPGGSGPASWSVFGDGEDGCLEADDDGAAPHRLELGIVPIGSGDEPYAITWSGAIAPGGDVLIFTRDQDDDQDRPRYGTIAMIRASPIASANTSIGAAVYMTFFHGAHTSSGPPTAELGAIVVPTQGAVSGWLQAPPPVGVAALINPTVARTARGRYAHVLRTSEQPREQSGWITNANDFAFVFSSVPVSSGFDLLESNTPSAPSLGFVVRSLGQNAPTP